MTPSDASLPLHKAIVAALKAAPTVTAVVAQRVYDTPSPGAVKPYISMGPVDVLTEEGDDDYEGSDTSIQIDGWTDGGSSENVKLLGRAVRETLHRAELALSENQRLVAMTVETIRYLREPDGLTQHAVITVRARTEPSA